MPGQLGGEKTTSAGVGFRVTGHLLSMVGVILPVALMVSGAYLGSDGIAPILSLIGMILGGIVLLGGIAAALLGSTTLGGAFLGYRFVNSHTRQPMGAVTLAKVLTQVVFECITVSLGTISYYLTYRDGQHWLDRAFNVVAVSNKGSETDPQGAASPVAMPVAPVMPRPAETDVMQQYEAPAPKMTSESVFAPPAYGGPVTRSATPKQPLRMPQPIVVGATGADGGQRPGFAAQQLSGFSASEAPGVEIQSTGVPAYPPTADPVPPGPGNSSQDCVSAVPGSSPAPRGDINWPVSAPTHGMPADVSSDQSAPGSDPVPTRAAEPVHPTSPFAPQPFPSPSPFPPPSPVSPSRASVFQPPAGSWVATSASPVFPPVVPARATTASPVDPPTAEPAPAARAAKTPSLVQDKTIADDGPEVFPEVVLDDGLRIKVDGPLVLGRNPLAPDDYPDARSVRVTDETMRLSKTHMVLQPIEGQVQVIDVGATNGVYIEADRERTRIPTHAPWPLSAGDMVHFGGRTLRLVS